MTLELHHFDFWPSSMAAKVALLERNAVFNTITVDMANGGHQTAAFLALSPSGEPPALVDTAGPSGLHPLEMFEASAVMSHLDANVQRLNLGGANFIPQTPCNIPLTHQWVAWTRVHLAPAIEGLLLHGKILARANRSATKFGAALQQFRAAVAVLETRVPAPGTFMNRDILHPGGGDKGTFSAADVVLASNLTYGRLLPQTSPVLDGSPSVLAYLGSIEARPAFQAALKGISLPGGGGQPPDPIEPP